MGVAAAEAAVGLNGEAAEHAETMAMAAAGAGAGPANAAATAGGERCRVRRRRRRRRRRRLRRRRRQRAAAAAARRAAAAAALAACRPCGRLRRLRPCGHVRHRGRGGDDVRAPAARRSQVTGRHCHAPPPCQLLHSSTASTQLHDTSSSTIPCRSEHDGGRSRGTGGRDGPRVPRAPSRRGPRREGDPSGQVQGHRYGGAPRPSSGDACCRRAECFEPTAGRAGPTARLTPPHSVSHTHPRQAGDATTALRLSDGTRVTLRGRGGAAAGGQLIASYLSIETWGAFGARRSDAAVVAATHLHAGRAPRAPRDWPELRRASVPGTQRQRHQPPPSLCEASASQRIRLSQLAARAEHCCALTEDGELYTFGQQTGCATDAPRRLNTTSTTTASPPPPPPPPTALTTARSLYRCNLSNGNLLGHGPRSAGWASAFWVGGFLSGFALPRKVAIPAPVVEVRCRTLRPSAPPHARSHPVVMSHHTDHSRYCQVSCSTLSTAAVTADGRIFTWGDCDGGALGHGNRLCDVPTEVELAVTTAAAPAAATAPADIAALLARAGLAEYTDAFVAHADGLYDDMEYVEYLRELLQVTGAILAQFWRNSAQFCAIILTSRASCCRSTTSSSKRS